MTEQMDLLLKLLGREPAIKMAEQLMRELTPEQKFTLTKHLFERVQISATYGAGFDSRLNTLGNVMDKLFVEVINEHRVELKEKLKAEYIKREPQLVEDALKVILRR